MKPDAFDRVVQEVLDELPKDLRGALKTVQIVVKEAPTVLELGRAGLEAGEDLYGFFDGVSLPDKSASYPDPFPDRVVLFRRALMDDFPKAADLKREIRITLIHELGHFFGMDEDDLAARGYE
jgi:predicted Zn-dependent protease with MMP-like domain